MNDLKETLEKAYESPYDVPWNSPELPGELVELIESGMLRPGKALDIGCGVGHHSIALAKKGFDVTGFDISGKAITAAQENATKQGVMVGFIELDALNVSQLDDTYDFVLEWGLLHFIAHEFRQTYIHDLAQKINKGGFYLALTFNEQSPEWGGGKQRTGITGAPIHYSSQEELKDLYGQYFEIIDSKIRDTFFKNSGNKHLHNYVLMRRK